MLKVYFAGPVTENLWRNKIFGFNPLVLEDAPPKIDNFKYAGPFVRNDNDDSVKHYEVCYAYADEVDLSVDADHPLSIENTTVYTESPSTVFMRSLRNIDDCNIVFAYIESVDNTGTLAEIMYAYSKDKYIVACVNDSIEVSDIWFPLQAINDVWELRNRDDLNEVWSSFLKVHPFQEYYKITDAQEYTIKKYYKNSKFKVVPELINKYDARPLIAAIKSEKYDISDIQNKLIKQGALVLKDESDVESVISKDQNGVRGIFKFTENEVMEKIISEYHWPPTTYSNKIEQLEWELGIKKNCEKSDFFKTINQRKVYSELWLLKVDEYYGMEKPIYTVEKFKDTIERELGISYSNSEFEDWLKRTKVMKNVIYGRNVEGKGRLFSQYAIERVIDIISKDGVYYDYVKRNFTEDVLNKYKYTFSDVERIIMEECYVTKDEFREVFHKLEWKYRLYRPGTTEFHVMNEKWDADKLITSNEVHYNERWLEILRKFISDTKMIYTFEKLKEQVEKQKTKVFRKLEFEQIVRNSKVRKDNECYKEKEKLFSPKALQSILNYLSNKEG